MSDNKIRIPAQKVELLKKICGARTGGYFSAEAIYNNIKLFIKKDLLKEFPVLDKNSNGSPIKKNLLKEFSVPEKDNNVSSASNSQLREIYRSYLKFMGSPSSWKNAMSGVGVSKAKFEAIPEIVDLYIEHFSYLVNSAETAALVTSRIATHTKELHFSPDIEVMIGDLVNWLCSCPECREPTRACTSDSPPKPIILGRACFIYGPEIGTPRYDPKVDVEFYGIDNGIWLCSGHADLVNGSGGSVFPAGKLLGWLRDHRIFVYEKVTGMSWVTSFGFHLESGSSELAVHLLEYISYQEFLFMDSRIQLPDFFASAVNNFRDYLEEELAEMKFPMFIARQVSGIIHICRAFVSMVQNPARLGAIEEVWQIFRKVMGHSLDTIANKYKLEMPGPLCVITPILRTAT